MKSELTMMRDRAAGTTVYTLTLHDLDMIRAKFDEFDYAVIDDCAQPGRTISDALLALELIVRRCEEAKDRV